MAEELPMGVISMYCTSDHDHESAWVCGPGMQVKFDLIQHDLERLMTAIESLTTALNTQ